jgi:hypothetical protein
MSLKPPAVPPYKKPFDLNCTLAVVIPDAIEDEDIHEDTSSQLAPRLSEEELAGMVRKELVQWHPIYTYTVSVIQEEDSEQNSFLVDIALEADERLYAEDLIPDLKQALNISGAAIAVRETSISPLPTYRAKASPR